MLWRVIYGAERAPMTRWHERWRLRLIAIIFIIFDITLCHYFHHLHYWWLSPLLLFSFRHWLWSHCHAAMTQPDLRIRHYLRHCAWRHCRRLRRWLPLMITPLLCRLPLLALPCWFRQIIDYFRLRCDITPPCRFSFHFFHYWCHWCRASATRWYWLRALIIFAFAITLMRYAMMPPLLMLRYRLRRCSIIAITLIAIMPLLFRWLHAAIMIAIILAFCHYRRHYYYAAPLRHYFHIALPLFSLIIIFLFTPAMLPLMPLFHYFAIMRHTLRWHFSLLRHIIIITLLLLFHCIMPLLSHYHYYYAILHYFRHMTLRHFHYLHCHYIISLLLHMPLRSYYYYWYYYYYYYITLILLFHYWRHDSLLPLLLLHYWLRHYFIIIITIIFITPLIIIFAASLPLFSLRHYYYLFWDIITCAIVFAYYWHYAMPLRHFITSHAIIILPLFSLLLLLLLLLFTLFSLLLLFHFHIAIITLYFRHYIIIIITSLLHDAIIDTSYFRHYFIIIITLLPHYYLHYYSLLSRFWYCHYITLLHYCAKTLLTIDAARCYWLRAIFIIFIIIQHYCHWYCHITPLLLLPLLLLFSLLLILLLLLFSHIIIAIIIIIIFTLFSLSLFIIIIIIFIIIILLLIIIITLLLASLLLRITITPHYYYHYYYFLSIITFIIIIIFIIDIFRHIIIAIIIILFCYRHFHYYYYYAIEPLLFSLLFSLLLLLFSLLFIIIAIFALPCHFATLSLRYIIIDRHYYAIISMPLFRHATSFY